MTEITGPYTLSGKEGFFFTISGAGSVNWTVPDDCRQISVSFVGGGGGDGESHLDQCGGGQGGRGTAKNVLDISVYPREKYLITVGDAGSSAGVSPWNAHCDSCLGSGGTGGSSSGFGESASGGGGGGPCILRYQPPCICATPTNGSNGPQVEGVDGVTYGNVSYGSRLKPGIVIIHYVPVAPDERLPAGAGIGNPWVI